MVFLRSIDTLMGILVDYPDVLATVDLFEVLGTLLGFSLGTMLEIV